MSGGDFKSRVLSKKFRTRSGDFLKDMGFADPSEGRVKAALSNEIALAVEELGLTQSAVAERAGLHQVDVSRIVNGNVSEYSVWRLMRVLAALGSDIAIHISLPHRENGSIFAVTPDEHKATRGPEVDSPEASNEENADASDASYRR